MSTRQQSFCRLILLCATLFTGSSLAEGTQLITAPPPAVDAKAYVVMDLDSHQIIAEKNANERVAPASLTKTMSLYVIAHALNQHQITLDDPVTISKNAWKTGGSRMFVKVGSQVPVRQLLQGIIVASGNDATVAMAEYVGGSEETFASMMNQAAAQLGMKDSHFTDATGLPHPDHYTTAHDLAILNAALLRESPQFKDWYQQKWFTYNKIKQPNRNRLLWRDSHVHGIKTGHTDDAGFCVINSATDHDMHLVSVVMGSKTDNARFDASESLLKYAFRLYQTQLLFKGRHVIASPRIWQGQERHAPLGIAKNLYVTTPSQATLTTKVEVDEPLFAPIKLGQAYGQVKVYNGNQLVAEQPLIALSQDNKGGLWTRFSDRIGYWLHNWLN